MSTQKRNYHEQVDQSINTIDEVNGMRIVEADETPPTAEQPKKEIASPGWSLYRSVFGNY